MNSITLNLLVYDHTPSRNPDFQSENSGVVEKGLVKQYLGIDGTPEFCCGNNRKGTIKSESSFYSWFHNQPGINLPFNKDIILTQIGNSNIYTYSNKSFFILDSEGFDDKKKYPQESLYYDTAKKARNFHFCAQTHTQFQYKTGDIFSFTGDDDVWVFINNKLVVDLGGMHPPASASINLDQLGLVNGNNYDFDFFYCERHSDGSSILISTSLKFVCPYYDDCGVCQGDNSSCCLPSNCELNPRYTATCLQAKCVNGLCNVPIIGCQSDTPCFDSVCTPNVGCSLVPKNCQINDPCTVDFCNTTINSCQHDVIPGCLSCSEVGCLTRDRCFPLSCSADGKSCSRNVKSCDDSDPCTTDYCSDGSCFHVLIPDCINCGGNQCLNTDKCSPVMCGDDGKSCVQKPIKCDDNNFCTKDSCSNGVCFSDRIENCQNCLEIGCVTTDFCNIQVCSSDGKSCETTAKNCSDNNFCTTDSCISPSGTCSFSIPDPKCVTCKSTSCTTTDACSIQVCSADGGSCESVPKNCDDNNPCTTDSCSNGVCSRTTIPNCSICNSTLSCITVNLCEPQFCTIKVSDIKCETNYDQCNDNNFCTKDTCSGNGICSRTPIENCIGCSASFGCITTDKCQPQICSEKNNSCILGNNGCDKGDKCTIALCISPRGTCSYAPKDCDDGDSCTIDSCDSTNGNCLHENILSCDTCGKLGCLTTDLCEPVHCSFDGTQCNKTVIKCDDNNHCTDDECNIGICKYTPKNDCIDCANEGCITTDLCVPKKCGADGNCYEDKINCDDENGCTTDICHDGTCSYENIENCVSCNNSFNCITTDFCLPQICSGDSLSPSCITNDTFCDDGDFCTTDTCSGDGICSHSSPDPLCRSCKSIRCMTTDLCKVQLCSSDGSTCQTDSVGPCDDKDPCTTDLCNAGICTHPPIDGCVACNETFSCITTAYCDQMICSNNNTECKKINRNCDDNNECTNDFCNSKDGVCRHAKINGCINCGKNICNNYDICSPMYCDISTLTCKNTTYNCDDRDPCTIDFCFNGTCGHFISDGCTKCSENFACFTIDPCKPIVCSENGSNICIETEKDCDDGNPCTMSTCENGTGTCLDTFIDDCIVCSKGIGCLTIDKCSPIICNENGDGCLQTSTNCSDNLFCTEDICTRGECTNPQIENCVECNDNIKPVFSFMEMSALRSISPVENLASESHGCYSNNKCVLVECSSNGTGCIYNDIKCDPPNPCQESYCEDGTCYSTPKSDCEICSNDFACITKNKCETQVCSKTKDSCITVPMDCDDGDDCTIDLCEPDTNCTHTPIANCGNFLTTSIHPPPIPHKTVPILQTPTPTNLYCEHCEKTQICIFIGDVPTCVPVTSLYSTTIGGHFTESGTTGTPSTSGLGYIPTTVSVTTQTTTKASTTNYNPCDGIKCNSGLQCYAIDNNPECMPSNYQCMDCLDLQCQLQGLSCKMVLNPSFVTDQYGRYDETCCKLIPSCKKRTN
ncbi:hypothetical protein RB653_004660 [Dictyostelium firmibasis]|uniref:PA14 domain-containing protein n=1 Tax=Dictyostelium firmibasis TaxID=79012 RepID=A0AAN7Z3I2_9MYCE